MANFVDLAEGKREWKHPNTGKKSNDRLYDGTIFHRVIPDFMIQGGDPQGTGMGGPGYQFEDETKGNPRHEDFRLKPPVHSNDRIRCVRMRAGGLAQAGSARWRPTNRCGPSDSTDTTQSQFFPKGRIAASLRGPDGFPGSVEGPIVG